MEVILVFLAIVVAMYAMFNWMQKKHTYPAKSSSAASKQALLSELGSLLVEGSAIEFTEKGNSYILSPPYLEREFTSLLEKYKSKTVFYIKLSLDEGSKTVYFKDYLTEKSSFRNFSGFSGGMSGSKQSGYISTSIYLYDGEQAVQINSDKLHDVLIEAVTANGWQLKLKVI